MAPWPSGKARVCKTLIPGSIPGGASRRKQHPIGCCFLLEQHVKRRATPLRRGPQADVQAAPPAACVAPPRRSGLRSSFSAKSHARLRLCPCKHGHYYAYVVATNFLRGTRTCSASILTDNAFGCFLMPAPARCLFYSYCSWKRVFMSYINLQFRLAMIVRRKDRNLHTDINLLIKQNHAPYHALCSTCSSSLNKIPPCKPRASHHWDNTSIMGMLSSNRNSHL